VVSDSIVRDVTDPPLAYGNPILFAGYFHDNETGLYHVRHRTYSPTLQRWLQRDPLEYVDGMNLYSYVDSHPIMRADPLGQWGKELHYAATKKIATSADVGMNEECAEVIASWDQGVDDWTGAALCPWFHFNAYVDLAGNVRKWDCGRDCWFGHRWNEGERKLRAARVWFGLEPSVYDGLAHIGEAMHHLQDKYSHQAGGQRATQEPGEGKPHMAETDFDHAPSWICLLRGDPFGIIRKECIRARKNNPNWKEPHRPDFKDLFPDDYRETLNDSN